MVNKSLYALAETLTKTEKRYLSLNIGSDRLFKTAIYADLFRVMLTCRSREEASHYVDSLRFSDKKKENIQQYLYNLILRNLRNFHNESTGMIQVKNLLIDAEILFHKGLMKQSLVKLDKAEGIAMKHENNQYLTDIGRWKQTIFIATESLFYKSPGLKKTAIYSAVELQRKAVDHLSKEVLYTELEVNYFFDPSKFSNKKKSLVHFNALMEDPVMNVPEKDLSLSSWFSLLALKSHAWYISGNPAESIKLVRKLIAVSEAKYPHVMKDLPSAWITLLFNYSWACYYSKKYDEVIRSAEKIRHTILASKNQLIQYKLWVNYYELILRAKTKAFHFSEANDVLEGATVFISNYEKQDKFIAEEKRKMNILYFIAYCYFLKHEYKKSIFWINKILQEANPKEVYMCGIHARILYFIIHLETKRVDKCKIAFSAFTKYIEKKNHGTFEKVMAELMEKAIQADALDVKVFRQQFLKFDKLPAKEKEQAEEFFGYTAWLKSKI